MRDPDEVPSSAPTVRGRGAWWYVAVFAVLLAAAVVAAILFFGDDDGGGYLWRPAQATGSIGAPSD